MIDCKTALELMERNQPLTRSERKELSDHLDGCSDCKVSAEFEDVLYGVIVPAELPSPSADFEAALMAELDIAPAIKPLRYPLLRWSWIIGVPAVILLLMHYYNPLMKTAFKTTHFLVLKAAGVLLYFNDLISNPVSSAGGQFDGFLRTVTSQITTSTSMEQVLIINLTIASIIILGSAVALGVVNRD
ncbi:zf-HC2 domain-containing protein [bacterium]|nr:zf-HC2 domain-containing protein [bacterium]